jgi:recombination protein RecR
VVLALGHDVKGETTSLYLSGELKSSSLRVTRLATGLSVGGSLEYADPQTLVHALQGRKEV